MIDVYKLYADIAGKKLIDASKKEQDIIDTMGEYLKSNKDLHFTIIKQKDKKSEPILKGVWGMQGYIEYLKDYKLRLESCIELKKEIVDLVEKPKVKTLGIEKN